SSARGQDRHDRRPRRLLVHRLLARHRGRRMARLRREAQPRQGRDRRPRRAPDLDRVHDRCARRRARARLPDSRARVVRACRSVGSPGRRGVEGFVHAGLPVRRRAKRRHERPERRQGARAPPHGLLMARARTAPTAAKRTERRSARESPALLETPDLQSVLAHALADVVAKTRAARAAAWWSEPGGTPRVVAAAGVDLPQRAPSADEFAALAALSHATDLGAIGADSVIALGYTAAAPVAPEAGGASAVLLLGGAGEEGGVRPRTLATLD